MKVLVTGSEGQLGLEIKNYSKKYGSLTWEFSTSSSLDFSALDHIKPFLDKTNPTHIINCAAYTNVDKAEQEYELADLINHKAIDIISKWTSRNGRKLIHISTDYVFDGTIKTPRDEKSKVNPINQYGLSKLNGERVCQKNDSNAIIIRTSWLYSSFGKNFVKTMIDLMKKNSSIEVVQDQIGSPTYTNDLAKVILNIITNFENESGLFHYSNMGSISWYEFAISIKELYSLNSKIIPIESSKFNFLAKRPMYSVLNKSKIKTTFKLDVPNYRLSLKNCIKIIKNQS